MGVIKPADLVEASICSLWRYHDIVDFEGFKKIFCMNDENSQNFPITAAIIREDVILPKIKYIVDILAWQAIVYKVSIDDVSILLHWLTTKTQSRSHFRFSNLAPCLERPPVT